MEGVVPIQRVHSWSDVRSKPHVSLSKLHVKRLPTASRRRGLVAVALAQQRARSNAELESHSSGHAHWLRSHFETWPYVASAALGLLAHNCVAARSAALEAKRPGGTISVIVMLSRDVGVGAAEAQPLSARRKLTIDTRAML